MEIYLFSNSSLDDTKTSEDAVRKVKKIAKKHHLFDTEIKRGENGKPFFSKSKEMFFNISHTDEITAIAFSNQEIGIDVEKADYFNEKIIGRFYSNDEKNEILNSGKDKDIQKLKSVEIWTRKEAEIKKQGKSIFNLFKNKGKKI